MKVIDRELEIPYTIIGHTSLNPSFNILLQGDSIKKIASGLKKDEDLRIVITEHNSEFTAVRTEEDEYGSDVCRFKEKKGGKLVQNE